jgi:hypothetical protein
MPYDACLYEGTQCVGIPSCGDDAINRTMVRVVATVVLIFGDACGAVAYFTAFVHIIHTVRVWAEVDLLQVHNNAIM